MSIFVASEDYSNTVRFDRDTLYYIFYHYTYSYTPAVRQVCKLWNLIMQQAPPPCFANSTEYTKIYTCEDLVKRNHINLIKWIFRTTPYTTVDEFDRITQLPHWKQIHPDTIKTLMSAALFITDPATLMLDYLNKHLMKQVRTNTEYYEILRYVCELAQNRNNGPAYARCKYWYQSGKEDDDKNRLLPPFRPVAVDSIDLHSKTLDERDVRGNINALSFIVYNTRHCSAKLISIVANLENGVFASLLSMMSHAILTRNDVISHLFRQFAYYGYLDAMKYLHEQFGSSILVHTIDHASVAAAEGGHENVVRMCHSWGALNYDDTMIGAAAKGHVKIVKLCATWGAKSFKDAMHGAARGGHIAVVRFCAMMFIAKSVNSAVYSSVEGGHIDIIQYCRDAGATDFKSVMNEAAIGGHGAIVELCKCWIPNNMITIQDLQNIAKNAAIAGSIYIMWLCKRWGMQDFEQALECAKQHKKWDVVCLIKRWMNVEMFV